MCNRLPCLHFVDLNKLRLLIDHIGGLLPSKPFWLLNVVHPPVLFAMVLGRSVQEFERRKCQAELQDVLNKRQVEEQIRCHTQQQFRHMQRADERNMRKLAEDDARSALRRVVARLHLEQEQERAEFEVMVVEDKLSALREQHGKACTS